MVKSEPKHRRRWLTWTGIIVGALVIIVLLLPTIVSYIIVPGMIQSAIAKQVDGKVEVSGTSFSWFGSQEIKTIKVASTDEETMIDAERFELSQFLFDNEESRMHEMTRRAWFYDKKICDAGAELVLSV